MKKSEKYLNNLTKANEQLEKALQILDNCYNTGKYLINKNYNIYAVNKIVTMQELLKDVKETYYIVLNKKGE